MRTECSLEPVVSLCARGTETELETAPPRLVVMALLWLQIIGH